MRRRSVGADSGGKDAQGESEDGGGPRPAAVTGEKSAALRRVPGAVKLLGVKWDQLTTQPSTVTTVDFVRS